MKNLLKSSLIVLFVCFIGTSLFAQEKEIPKATEKNNTFVVNVDFHCGGGKARLENGLGKIDGVDEVDADLETKNVTIKHDSEVVSTKDLVRAIEKIGHATEYTCETTEIKSACTHH